MPPNGEAPGGPNQSDAPPSLPQPGLLARVEEDPADKRKCRVVPMEPRGRKWMNEKKRGGGRADGLRGIDPKWAALFDKQHGVKYVRAALVVEKHGVRTVLSVEKHGVPTETLHSFLTDEHGNKVYRRQGASGKDADQGRWREWSNALQDEKQMAVPADFSRGQEERADKHRGNMAAQMPGACEGCISASPAWAYDACRKVCCAPGGQHALERRKLEGKDGCGCRNAPASISPCRRVAEDLREEVHYPWGMSFLAKVVPTVRFLRDVREKPTFMEEHAKCVNGAGETWLLYAAERNLLEVGRVLVEQFHADVHAISTGGLGSALSKCAENALHGDTLMLELLMGHADLQKPCTHGGGPTPGLTLLGFLRRELKEKPHVPGIEPLLEAIVQQEKLNDEQNALLDQLGRKAARRMHEYVMRKVVEDLDAQQGAAVAAPIPVPAGPSQQPAQWRAVQDLSKEPAEQAAAERLAAAARAAAAETARGPPKRPRTAGMGSEGPAALDGELEDAPIEQYLETSFADTLAAGTNLG